MNQNKHIAMFLIMTVTSVKNNSVQWPKDPSIKEENYIWDGKRYHFSYLTTFGVYESQTGKLETASNGNLYIEKRGQYNVPTIDGFKTVYYIANDKGYNVVKEDNMKSIQPASLNIRTHDLSKNVYPTNVYPVQETTTKTESDNIELSDRIALPQHLTAILIG